jgi:hypothetical protein
MRTYIGLNRQSIKTVELTRACISVKIRERDYDNGINLNIFSPNILFIDLDAKRFDSMVSLQKALKQILKIASLLHHVKPFLMWSGRGYHIIIPVNAKEALENFTDFTPYTTEPSKEFLQFCRKILVTR